MNNGPSDPDSHGQRERAGHGGPSQVATSCEQLTEEQLAEAKEYGRKELICGLADKCLDVLYLAVVAVFFAGPLERWLARWPGLEPLTLRLAGMFLAVTCVHAAVSMPLSLYGGYILEHRYGLSRQSLARWLWRYAKRNLLALSFGLVMVEGIYWMIWLVGSFWWLAAAIGFFLVSIVLGQLAPVVILPMFSKIVRLDDPALAERLSRLAEGTGLSIAGIYRMELSKETVKANAMLAGLGRTRRVILGDTLLDNFSPQEIEVIFAHEVGHHVHRHVPKMILAGLVYSLGSFFLCDLLLAVWAGGAAGRVDYATLPVSTLPMLMLAITVLSLLLEPLQNIISRHFERQCDWYALQRTRRAADYRSAFCKLARLNKADPDPHPLEVFLFHSHPTISQRLAMADRLS